MRYHKDKKNASMRYIFAVALYLKPVSTHSLVGRARHISSQLEEILTGRSHSLRGKLHSGKTSTHALTLSISETISDRVVIFPRFVLRVVVFEVFKIKRAFTVWVRFSHSPLR